MSGVRFAVLYNKLDTSYTMPYKHEHEHYEIYYLISGDRFYFIRSIYHVHQEIWFYLEGYIHRTTEADSSVGSMPATWCISRKNSCSMCSRPLR